STPEVSFGSGAAAIGPPTANPRASSNAKGRTEVLIDLSPRYRRATRAAPSTVTAVAAGCLVRVRNGPVPERCFALGRSGRPGTGPLEEPETSLDHTRTLRQPAGERAGGA